MALLKVSEEILAYANNFCSGSFWWLDGANPRHGCCSIYIHVVLIGAIR